MVLASKASEENAECLISTRVDGVATLTLNRPAQFNALSEALLTALQEALDSIARDASISSVVIAGLKDHVKA